MKMRTCVLQCCLTLLGLSLVLCSNGVSSQPDLDLRPRRLLQRFQGLGVAAQEWTKNDLKNILSQLTLPESEFQESDISTLGTKQDLTMEFERSAEDPDSLPLESEKQAARTSTGKDSLPAEVLLLESRGTALATPGSLLLNVPIVTCDPPV